MRYERTFTMQIPEYFDGTICDWEREGLTTPREIADAIEVELYNHVLHDRVMQDLPTWCDEEQCEDAHRYNNMFVSVNPHTETATVEVWWTSDPLPKESEEESEGW